MDSLFDDCVENKKINRTKHCSGCICQLLIEQLSSNDDCQLLLIINKGTSQPLSLDGSNTPTQFILESFDSDTCCAVFSFEDILDTSPLKTVRRIFVENCHEIAGIVFIERDFCDLI